MKFTMFSKKAATPVDILSKIDAYADSRGVVGAIPAEMALSVGAVFACVRVISEDAAKLPSRVRLKTSTGSEIATDHPANDLLATCGKRPNDDDDGFTAFEWKEQTFASAALHGLGVVYLNRFKTFKGPAGAEVGEVTPILTGYWQRDKNVWKIRDTEDGWMEVPRSNLMVLKGPQLGVNVTYYARQAIQLASDIDRMMTSIAAKSGRPNGLLSSETFQSEARAQTFVDRIAQYFGPSGTGGLMALDLGQLHHVRLSMTPEELQQNETYARAVTQIASAYRVQPARIMQEMTTQTSASAHQWNIAHVNDTIQPWIERFTQRFDVDVLGADQTRQGYYSDIELKGLLRGSPQERAEYYLKMRTMGAMSPAAVAALEDMPTEGVSNDATAPLLTNPNPAAEATEND